jgi:4-hydroxybenzoate polyprenyltransferase
LRSTRNQKLLALAVVVLALLLLTPLAPVAVGAALLGVVALLMIRFYPRRRGHDQG